MTDNGFPLMMSRSRCGESTASSMYTVNEKITSSASKGWPSEKRIPLRSWSVKVRPSGDAFQDFASLGLGALTNRQTSAIVAGSVRHVLKVFILTGRFGGWISDRRRVCQTKKRSEQTHK